MLDSFMNAVVEQIGQSGVPSVSALMLLVAVFYKKVLALVSKCLDGPLVDALLKGSAVLSKDLYTSCSHPNFPVVSEGSDEYARCRTCVLGIVVRPLTCLSPCQEPRPFLPAFPWVETVFSYPIRDGGPRRFPGLWRKSWHKPAQ